MSVGAESAGDGDGSHRPRDLAVLLLALGGGSPRQRARDQQADLAGSALQRRVLDRIAAIDPEPDTLDATLARIIEEFGNPTGPTRGVCLGIREEWQACSTTPGAWAWLLAEAVEAGQGIPKRRRSRGPEIAP